MCMSPLSHLAPENAEAPLVVYTAKKIATMERDNPEATAVAVSGKQIVVAGSLEEVKEFLGDKPTARMTPSLRRSSCRASSISIFTPYSAP